MTIKIKTSFFLIFLIFIFIVSAGFFVIPKIKNGELQFLKSASLIQPVSAAEIYPLFLCPCCGAPLDKNKICCAQAQERIDYIDSLSGTGASENEIILNYVKKYGLNSFIDKSRQEEIRGELIKSAPAERPIISLSPVTYDFGDVSVKGGVVSFLFDLKNEGKKDLVINRMDTSCGCTSAVIVFNGQEGPRFAMPGHGIENPVGWEVVIPPGESGKLKVYYDPTVHKDLIGAVIREISVYSNDPIDFEKKVQIELNQVE